jgi:CAAX protease family protein
MDAIEPDAHVAPVPGIDLGAGGPEGDGFPVGASRAFLGLALAALGTILATLVITIVFVTAGVDNTGDNHSFLLLATLAQDASFVVVAYLLTSEKAPVSAATFGFRRFGPSAFGTMAIAFAAYYALSLVYNALVGPPCDKLPDDLGVNDSALLAVLAGIFVIGVAPLAEEFFFRGFLFQAMRQSWGVWLAAPASGLIFGAIHFQPDKLVPLAILGTALAFVFHRTRSLWPCILLHALNNTIAFIVLLSNVSC